jgi:hypothetical protein
LPTKLKRSPKLGLFLLKGRLVSLCEPDVAISLIREYMSEHLFDPKQNWGKYYFTERSYSRWAANEIIERLWEIALFPPWEYGVVDIISGFIDEMERLSENSEHKLSQTIFYIAKETARDILLLFV